MIALNKKRIITVITVIFLLVLLGIVLFSGDGKKETQKKTSTVPKAVVLNDFIDRDSRVSFVLDGKVNGDDIHRSVKITVARGSRNVELIQGYEGQVIKSASFGNNPQAYDVFLRSLARQNFTKERKKVTQTEVRGSCPLGNRYIYQIIDNSDIKFTSWSSTCQNTGTSAANVRIVNDLFQKQIPDYQKFVSGVEF